MVPVGVCVVSPGRAGAGRPVWRIVATENGQTITVIDDLTDSREDAESLCAAWNSAYPPEDGYVEFVVDGPPGPCGRCGKNPAEGFASINDEWFCHDGDGIEPTCYMLASRRGEWFGALS